jgi:hypothetical protein
MTSQQAQNPLAVLQELHLKCGTVLTATLQPKYAAMLGESHQFVGDLDSWVSVIGERQERILLELAAQEYLLSLLAACQGQYRNAFKGLRLSLELCLQGTYLSSNLILLAEWLGGVKDTNWSELNDNDRGLFSVRSSRAFFPELEPNVAHFATLARTLYRELSECIHGNVPIRIPLPSQLAFDEPSLLLWHDKARTLRLVVLFVLCLRYLKSVSHRNLPQVEPCVMDQLGHIAAIRAYFGGPATS